MATKSIKELHITVGMPGSGKTTFVNDKSNFPGAERVQVNDFDKVFKKLKKENPDKPIDIEKVREMVFQYNTPNVIAIDGLFLTQKDVEWALSVYLDSDYFLKYFNIKKVVVDYWKFDKEACLWNDKGRRSQNSVATIKSAKMEKPDIEQIEKRFGVPTKMVEHEIVRKSIYKVFADCLGIPLEEDNKYFYSDTWRTGGEYSSWNSDSTTRMDSEAPCEFELFDEVMERICPNITFLQYKKLYRSCVELGTRHQSDYYSWWDEDFYKCNIEKLYDMLFEMGYIEEGCKNLC